MKKKKTRHREETREDASAMFGDDDAVLNKVLSRRVAVVSPRRIHFREHLSS